METYTLVTMALHAAVDLLLMMGANQLCGYEQQWKRMLPGALIGCLHSGACLQPGFYFLGNVIWRGVALTLTALTAFGWDGSALRRGLVFGVMRLAVLGALEGAEERFWTAVLAASVICLLSLIGFGDGAGKQYIPVRIRHDGNTAAFTALVDTGNLLSDPVTGNGILIVGPQVAQALLQLTPAQVADPVETMQHSALPGLRLIPYQTIGRKGGLLLGMRFRDVQMGEKVGPQTVAFAPYAIGEGKSFQALAGGVV